MDRVRIAAPDPCKHAFERAVSRNDFEARVTTPIDHNPQELAAVTNPRASGPCSHEFAGLGRGHSWESLPPSAITGRASAPWRDAFYCDPAVVSNEPLIRVGKFWEDPPEKGEPGICAQRAGICNNSIACDPGRRCVFH